jgi:hypothetical protein
LGVSVTVEYCVKDAILWIYDLSIWSTCGVAVKVPPDHPKSSTVRGGEKRRLDWELCF